MDLLAELETMAINAADHHDDFEPSESEILQWQKLFSYTYSEAVERIRARFDDYARSRISDDQWAAIKADKEAQGFSRDAYEHWIGISGKQQRSETKSPNATANISYLLLLNGILSTPEVVQQAAELQWSPANIPGASDSGKETYFVKIDGISKQKIEEWLAEQKSAFKPTFVRVSKARKELSPTSIHPTLGLDSTLPQHRATISNLDLTLPQYRGLPDHPTISPLQDEYPVWYFFYGTLADPVILSRLLSLPEYASPILFPARISGGATKTWGGKYLALIDSDTNDKVLGSAYQVKDCRHEEVLLAYETEKYEVVRCLIDLDDRQVSGLTFRFVGNV